MPRRKRISVPGITEHIYHRSIKNRKFFQDDEDKEFYLRQLELYSSHYQVAIHAWVLMDRHVRILCTPTAKTAVSKMMQSIGRQYVSFANRKYDFEGSMMKDRYKSCLIDDSNYFLQVCRYVELNPQRSRTVEHVSDYSWSSYRSNALGIRSGLLTQHHAYLGLGKSKGERCLSYRRWCRYVASNAELDAIRRSLRKGLVYGSEPFKVSLEMATGYEFIDRDPGRPSLVFTA